MGLYRSLCGFLKCSVREIEEMRLLISVLQVPPLPRLAQWTKSTTKSLSPRSKTWHEGRIHLSESSIRALEPIIHKSYGRVGINRCVNARFDVPCATYTHPKTEFSTSTLRVVEGEGATYFPSVETYS
jgi:hypothetical protein